MKQGFQKGSYQDWLNRSIEDISNKQFTFKLLKKNQATSIIDGYGKPMEWVGSFVIPNVAVINERDKAGNMTQKTIRYIPGESSIYKDQQSNDKDVPKKAYKIKFTNGRRVVGGTEVYLLEFMMKCNQNSTNPMKKADVQAVFELLDTSIAVSKEIAKDKLINEVTNWCWNGSWEEVAAYARVLTINLNQSPEEVRHHLKIVALRDPEKFLRDLKNPAMKKKHYVLEAIDRNYLLLDPQSNSIAWTNNPHAPIVVAAVGTSPVDVLVQKLSTDEGRVLYSAIVDLLTPEPVVVTKLHVPSPQELIEMKQTRTVIVEPAPVVVSLVDESDSELMDIVEEGIKLNLITFQPPMWYKYKGESGKKKEGFVDKLKGNINMLKSLRYEIQKAKDAIPA